MAMRMPDDYDKLLQFTKYIFIDKLLYQLCVDEGSGRCERDNSCRFERYPFVRARANARNISYCLFQGVHYPHQQTVGTLVLHYTVEPPHVELRYLELSAISDRIGFPLDLPLFFQSLTMGYLELGYLEHPAISNCFSLPLAQISPSHFKLYYIPKKHWSKSVRKCSQGTS